MLLASDFKHLINQYLIFILKISFDCVFVELPYNDYFEYYGPDFKLHISTSNMANQNTPEYLDKIKARLFENMRMLPHAPGVQMTGTYTRFGHYELSHNF